MTVDENLVSELIASHKVMRELLVARVAEPSDEMKRLITAVRDLDNTIQSSRYGEGTLAAAAQKVYGHGVASELAGIRYNPADTLEGMP